VWNNNLDHAGEIYKNNRDRKGLDSRKTKDFSPAYTIQTGSGDHHASYPIGSFLMNAATWASS
jgi:hypothetical protein